MAANNISCNPSTNQDVINSLVDLNENVEVEFVEQLTALEVARKHRREIRAITSGTLLAVNVAIANSNRISHAIAGVREQEGIIKELVDDVAKLKIDCQNMIEEQKENVQAFEVQTHLEQATENYDEQLQWLKTKVDDVDYFVREAVNGGAKIPHHVIKKSGSDKGAEAHED